VNEDFANLGLVFDNEDLRHTNVFCAVGSKLYARPDGLLSLEHSLTAPIICQRRLIPFANIVQSHAIVNGSFHVFWDTWKTVFS
jgi:hypothetical protein